MALQARDIPANVNSAIKLVRAEIDKLDTSTVREISKEVESTLSEIARTLSKPSAMTNFQRSVSSRAYSNMQDTIDDFEKRYDEILARRQNEAGDLGSVFAQGRAAIKNPELPAELFTPVNVSRVESMASIRLDLVASLKESSQRKIRAAIQRGIIEGSANGEVQSRIMKYLDSPSTFGTITARAETIARTETLRAYSVGHQIDMNRIATVMPNIEKQWVSYIDNRTRESHVKVNGDTVKWNEYFTVGSTRLLIPRDPDGLGMPDDVAAETINCRCAVVMA